MDENRTKQPSMPLFQSVARRKNPFPLEEEEMGETGRSEWNQIARLEAGCAERVSGVEEKRQR